MQRRRRIQIQITKRRITQRSRLTNMGYRARKVSELLPDNIIEILKVLII
jgi:hypothetical protein